MGLSRRALVLAEPAGVGPVKYLNVGMANALVELRRGRCSRNLNLRVAAYRPISRFFGASPLKIYGVVSASRTVYVHSFAANNVRTNLVKMPASLIVFSAGLLSRNALSPTGHVHT